MKVAFFQSGIKQKDIAAALGMDEGHMSRIVNGLHTDDRTRERIADALGKTTDELWPSTGLAA